MYLGLQPALGNYRKLDSITSQFNGIIKEFPVTISGVPAIIGTSRQCILSLNNVILEAGISFSIGSSGTSIVFTTPPAFGTPFWCIIIGDALDIASTADDSISTSKIVNNAVTNAKIADGSITTTKILDANVTTTKILDANVTNSKIADNAITLQKIQDNAVVTSKIADANVTTIKILDANVTTSKIADLNVTTGKIANNAIDGTKLADGTVSTSKIVDDAVTKNKIANSTAGAVDIYDASGNPTVLAPGTTGFVLTTNGPGVAPSWQPGAGVVITAGFLSSAINTNNYTWAAGTYKRIEYYLYDAAMSGSTSVNPNFLFRMIDNGTVKASNGMYQNTLIAPGTITVEDPSTHTGTSYSVMLPSLNYIRTNAMQLHKISILPGSNGKGVNLWGTIENLNSYPSLRGVCQGGAVGEGETVVCDYNSTVFSACSGINLLFDVGTRNFSSNTFFKLVGYS